MNYAQTVPLNGPALPGIIFGIVAVALIIWAASKGK